MVGKNTTTEEDSRIKIKTRELSKSCETLASGASQKILPKPESKLLQFNEESNKKEYSPTASMSWRQRHCPFKDKLSAKKLRRGDERCKYCRRLLSHSSTVKSGTGNRLTTCNSNYRSSSSRRPFENTLDEVAWACGRLWCSVRRRKNKRVLLHHKRKKVKIDEAFSTLREILPPAAQSDTDKDSEAAKVSTLRLAASYIQALSDLLKDTHLTDKYSKDDNPSEPSSPSETIDQNKEENKNSKIFIECISVAQNEDSRDLINKLKSVKPPT